MRARFRKVLPVLLLLSTLLPASQAQAAHERECRTLHGQGVGQDLGGGRTQARITHAGVLNGTTTGVFTTAGTPPVFAIAGTVTFTTEDGTLTVTVTGTFDVTTGRFTASGPVTASSDDLAGATGNLTLAGTENLTTGKFVETITGQICVVDD